MCDCLLRALVLSQKRISTIDYGECANSARDYVLVIVALPCEDFHEAMILSNVLKAHL